MLGDVSLSEPPADPADLHAAVLLARKLNLPITTVNVPHNKAAEISVRRASVRVASTQAVLDELSAIANSEKVPVRLVETRDALLQD